MSPIDEEIDRVAALMHHTFNDTLANDARLRRDRRYREDEVAVTFEQLGPANKDVYRAAARAVISDLWAGWQPTTGGPTMVNPTHEMLAHVQTRMYDLRGWRYAPTVKYRRHYRRLKRIETYLVARLGR